MESVYCHVVKVQSNLRNVYVNTLPDIVKQYNTTVDYLKRSKYAAASLKDFEKCVPLL